MRDALRKVQTQMSILEAGFATVESQQRQAWPEAGSAGDSATRSALGQRGTRSVQFPISDLREQAWISLAGRLEQLVGAVTPWHVCECLSSHVTLDAQTLWCIVQRSNGVLSCEEHFTMVRDMYHLMLDVPFVPPAPATMQQQVWSHALVVLAEPRVCCL